MYLEQGQAGKKNIIFYIIGFFVVFGFTQMGFIAIYAHLAVNGIQTSATSPMDVMKEFSSLINKNLLLFYVTSGFTVAIGALYLWIKFVHKRSFFGLITSRTKISWKKLLFAFLLQAILVIGGFAYSYYTAPEEFTWQFQLAPFIGLLIVASIFISLQSALEETLFRGYLLQGLAIPLFSRLIPIIITSVIFGLLHMSNPEVVKHGNILFLYYIGFGLFSAIWCIMDDGLELSIGSHIANNLITSLLVCSPESVLQTNSLFYNNTEIDPASAIISFYISACVLTIIFSFKYRWKGWRKLVNPVVLISK